MKPVNINITIQQIVDGLHTARAVLMVINESNGWIASFVRKFITSRVLVRIKKFDSLDDVIALLTLLIDRYEILVNSKESSDES